MDGDEVGITQSPRVWYAHNLVQIPTKKPIFDLHTEGTGQGFSLYILKSILGRQMKVSQLQKTRGRLGQMGDDRRLSCCCRAHGKVDQKGERKQRVHAVASQPIAQRGRAKRVSRNPNSNFVFREPRLNFVQEVKQIPMLSNRHSQESVQLVTCQRGRFLGGQVQNPVPRCLTLIRRLGKPNSRQDNKHQKKSTPFHRKIVADAR